MATANNLQSSRVLRRPRVLLFDIDGTLLTADGAGKRALTQALHQVFGLENAVAGIDFRGMTDTLIIEQAMARWSRAVQPSEIDKVFAVYLEHLAHELEASISARALPGAKQLLDLLITQGESLVIGLGTGNIETAARMKLGRVELDHYFTFGGFGSDHKVRSEIIRVAAQRGCARLGCPMSECEVLVIGDTFHDIDAALTIGARAVGVGTSGVCPEAMLARGASHAFQTMQDPAIISALLE